MKLVVFRDISAPTPIFAGYRIGAILDDDSIADLTPSILPMGLSAAEVLRCYDLAAGFLPSAIEAISGGDLPILELDEVKLESPVPRPGKIICIGLNYRDHAEETGAALPAEPVVFMKDPSTVVGPYSAQNPSLTIRYFQATSYLSPGKAVRNCHGT